MSGATLVPLGLLLISRTGLLPSSVCLSRQLLLSDSCFVSGPQPHTKVWFGLFPFRSPLLRESMFLSGYLDVSVHRVASDKAMDSLYGACALPHAGFPIRISAGRRLFAPYRSFSQLAASFFGSYCQGIRLMLFVS